MNPEIEVQPLARKERKRTFVLMILVFLIAIPFLYMYATGYRFDITKPTSIISTGGLYVAVDVPEVDLFINDDLVTGARTFRNDFYVQQLDIETHRVHVQKAGYHTWVKELPVSERLVTEVKAFNLPEVPQVRVISGWVTATGSAVVSEDITNASTTNPFVATTTKKLLSFEKNNEFVNLRSLFATTSTSTNTSSAVEEIRDLILGSNATTTEDGLQELSTTTKRTDDVRLFEIGEDVYVRWEGPFERMPYYYCAEEFERYSSTTASSSLLKDVVDTDLEEVNVPDDVMVLHPVQAILEEEECDPTIKIDRKWQTVHDFDFLPGSEDFVILVLDDGVYVVEVDDRAWQNVQPLFMGENLEMRIERGDIYLYDGTLIYQVFLEIEEA